MGAGLAVALVLLAGATSGAGDRQPAENPDWHAQQMTEIRITIGRNEIFATLDDSASARDFLSLLPLSLTLEDYAKTEKVSDLPRRLSIDGAPDGYKPSAGDITYYAPWGNLAIFYRDFRYSPGLVGLGNITGPIEPLITDGKSNVRIETTRNPPESRQGISR